MNELENNGVVRLCGKQREFYHVDFDQVKDKFCFNSSGGGGGDFIARPGSHVIMFRV